MVGKIRLIICGKQNDMINVIKNGFERKYSIESILVVAHPRHAENKLVGNCINILVWDLDDFLPDSNWVRHLMHRHANVYIVYTSLASSRYSSVPKTGKDEFLQKPAMFFGMTSDRFRTSLENHMESLLVRQRPPAMRDLLRMVDNLNKQKIIAIGSSTGGTNALEDIFKVIPADTPPIVVVQHMPSGFTKLFADRLNVLYKQEIKEAQTGDFLMRGRVLIAPAEKHMRVVRQQGKLAVECYEGNRIHGVMPAADVLFESVAEVVKSEAVGVILTGMGNDGARGLLQMKKAGCQIIGQNEATCVVYGMPKAAKDLGAVHFELPLGQIPDKMIQLARL